MAGIAIVTGAGTGIGKACALALAEAGWRTVFTGRRPDILDEAVSQAEADQDRVAAIACDVTDPADVDRLFAETVRRFGRVDLLFNNAGASLRGKTIDEIEPEEWNLIVSVNLTGSFLCARAAFRQMRMQAPQGGRVINNGSISAHTPRPGSAAYTATKHAITGLTKTIALDGRPFDIACGQIDIGNTDSSMAAGMRKGVLQANGTVAVEAVFELRHVVDAVLYLAGLPLGVNVPTMTVMATQMPYVGRG
jgi:NAD(P)-dependent dehydrogenase (short-subunit alcohol dehydrogenase family)